MSLLFLSLSLFSLLLSLSLSRSSSSSVLPHCFFFSSAARSSNGGGENWKLSKTKPQKLGFFAVWDVIRGKKLHAKSLFLFLHDFYGTWLYSFCFVSDEPLLTSSNNVLLLRLDVRCVRLTGKMSCCRQNDENKRKRKRKRKKKERTKKEQRKKRMKKESRKEAENCFRRRKRRRTQRGTWRPEKGIRVQVRDKQQATPWVTEPRSPALPRSPLPIAFVSLSLSLSAVALGSSSFFNRVVHAPTVGAG